MSSDIKHLELTARDLRLIDLYITGEDFKSEIAASVNKQGWISEKQRAVLEGNNRYHQEDYEEEDYEIGAFELCVDGYGD